MPNRHVCNNQNQITRLKELFTRRRTTIWIVLLLLTVALTGCQTVSYYTQAVRGHCQVLARRQSCEKLIADSNTSEELRAKLQLAREMCAFARDELKLPVNSHYQRYADVGRRFVVWNVTACPEFTLESKTWWYPVVGSLEYRGFFAENGAREYADRLSRKGFDIYVEGVEAYSTLGWFKDPLLNTFIHHPEAALAEILFHELAHQRVFASGDTDFNEAFATVVGQEGARRWLSAKGDAVALEKYLTGLQRNDQFVLLVTEARKKLEVLFGDQLGPDGKIKATKTHRSFPMDRLRQEKRRIQDELRRDYEKLKAEWGGYAGYDAWFAGGLSNAQLNSVATYYDLVPAFERWLIEYERDLEKFYLAVRQLAKLPKAKRHQRLGEPPGPLALQ